MYYRDRASGHVPLYKYSSISRNIAGSHSNTEKPRNSLTPHRSACEPQNISHYIQIKLNSRLVEWQNAHGHLNATEREGKHDRVEGEIEIEWC